MRKDDRYPTTPTTADALQRLAIRMRSHAANMGPSDKYPVLILAWADEVQLILDLHKREVRK